MNKRTVTLLWIAVAVLAFVVFIVGWVMGDIGLGFSAFLVRWIVPIIILVGFGMFRRRAKQP